MTSLFNLYVADGDLSNLMGLLRSYKALGNSVMQHMSEEPYTKQLITFS